MDHHADHPGQLLQGSDHDLMEREVFVVAREARSTKPTGAGKLLQI